MWVPLLLALPLFSCTAPTVSKVQDPYRRVPQLDLRIFAYAPSPAYHGFSSRAELMKTLGDLAPHVPAASYPELKGSFLRSIESASVRWEEEALFVLGEYYGTGMAKARLDLTTPALDVVEATIVWKVPPPPVTPDTAVFRCAFVVNKAVVKRVVLSGRDRKKVVIPIGP